MRPGKIRLICGSGTWCPCPSMISADLLRGGHAGDARQTPRRLGLSGADEDAHRFLEEEDVSGTRENPTGS